MEVRSYSLNMVQLKSSWKLMGRQLHTDVPQVFNLLIPDWPHLLGFQEKDAEDKKQQKKQYDCHHWARTITIFLEDTEVWVTMQDR